MADPTTRALDQSRLVDAICYAVDQSTEGDAAVLGMVQALEAVGLDGLSRVLAWESGVLNESSPPAAAAVLRFNAVLLAPAGSLADTAINREIIYSVVLRCAFIAKREMNLEINPPAARPGRVDSEDDAVGRAAFNLLSSMQGRFVDLDRRPEFVARAFASVKDVGYPTSVPNLLEVKAQGCTQTAQKFKVGDGATLEVGGTVARRPADMPTCIARLRMVTDGLAAALGQKRYLRPLTVGVILVGRTRMVRQPRSVCCAPR